MNLQVIGAGSFGLALSRVLAINGHQVRLWCRSGGEVLRERRESPAYLPGVILPRNVVVLDTLDPEAELVVLAVPSHALRGVLTQLPLPEGAVRVSVVKGIENNTLARMSEIIAAVAPEGPVVALSGPSHAEEVGHDLPASVVVAGEDHAACVKVQEAFLSKTFRVYTSPDLVGVELGGALKNVIAIAAGVCDGLGLGDNAKAALITRGLAEISRLGVAAGADPLTFAGLSGMGDLIATCGSKHSRNRAVGEQIARGKTLEEILAGMTMVAEGIRTTQSAQALALKFGVAMPIAESTYKVLFEGAPARAAISELMLREAKPEITP